ncbi:hypothetical protein Ahy_A06g028266 [Arachis hypogaea]|uniref:RNase H type-1 domain-containing protein n=1 Tax=Arachis hypogaea TaxID=3818 RepID=A0A445CQM1_ARAHY|nr:hypothetical protein Ahy_A06g028266 [Arachis hypogaea]
MGTKVELKDENREKGEERIKAEQNRRDRAKKTHKKLMEKLANLTMTEQRAEEENGRRDQINEVEEIEENAIATIQGKNKEIVNNEEKKNKGVEDTEISKQDKKEGQQKKWKRRARKVESSNMGCGEIEKKMASCSGSLKEWGQKKFANQILALPIDMQRQDDRFYWKFIKEGESCRRNAIARMGITTLKQIEKERKGLFICCLHSLWHSRNKLLFENENVAPETILERAAISFAEALRPTNSSPLIQEPPPSSQSPSGWRTPPPGRYKINVDAASNNGVKGGVGVVIRDSNGVVVAAAMLEVAPALSVREAEAFSFYQGVNIVAQTCFLEIEIEGDNIEVVNALNSNSSFGGPFGTIISNCKALLCCFRFYKMSHIKRNGNSVVHSLAKLALTKPNLMWLEETPTKICNLVHLDILGQFLY